MTTYTPVRKQIVNAFDHFGMLLGLPRIPNERNAEYRKRLLTVFSQRAGAHSQGLINGITRELGLEQYDALSVATSSTENPRVVITDTNVYLYSDWTNSDTFTLEKQIDTYSRDGDGYYLSDLADAISLSTHFSAAVIAGVDGHVQSGTLLRTDSRIWVDNFEVKPFNTFSLGNTILVDGTVTFSSNGRKSFVNEVASTSQVVADGDYYIDYTNGVCFCYTAPANDVTCRYQYDQMPMLVKASPVMLYEFGSEEFRKMIFNQLDLYDGTTVDGLPDPEAVDFINELLSAKSQLWGS